MLIDEFMDQYKFKCVGYDVTYFSNENRWLLISSPGYHECFYEHE